MKVFLLIALALILSIASADSARVERQGGSFKTAIGGSSRELYDLFEFNPDSVFVVAFHKSGNDHDQVISELENGFQNKENVFENVVYVQVDATDDYQYNGILYDLNIDTAPHHMYPFFLVMKDETGQLVRGEKSEEIIHNIVEDYMTQ